MHDNNIEYYKDVNKKQVKMWHIFLLVWRKIKNRAKYPVFII